MSFIRGSASGQTTPSLSDSGSSTEEVKTTREPPLKKERLFLSGSTSSSEPRTNSFRSAQTKKVKKLPPKFPIEKRFVLVYGRDPNHLQKVKNWVADGRLHSNNVFVLGNRNDRFVVKDIDGKTVVEPLKNRLDQYSKLTIYGHGNDHSIGVDDEHFSTVERLIHCGVNKPVGLLKLMGCSNGLNVDGDPEFLEALQDALLKKNIQVGFFSGKQGLVGYCDPLHLSSTLQYKKPYKNSRAKFLGHMGISPSIRKRPTTKKILRSAVLGTAHLLTGGLSILPTAIVAAKVQRTRKNKLPAIEDRIETYEIDTRARIEKFGHSAVTIHPWLPNFKTTEAYQEGIKGDRPIFFPWTRLNDGGIEVPGRYATRVIRNPSVTGIEPSQKYTSPPGYEAWKRKVDTLLESRGEAGKRIKRTFRAYLDEINFLHLNKRSIYTTLTSQNYRDTAPKRLLALHKWFRWALEYLVETEKNEEEVKQIKKEEKMLIDHVLTEYEAAQKELLGKLYNKAT